ncbi:hypothetical protein MLD38_019754 [Melastoma candidum]|uniref:Uncharacterized protein n=1 Tax=Melastoma candidum TaxID=119954 RepID=A0ACB9QXH1_9MYRT|nr:hypothetical protein MLD38_019754 [Melastoma candidum]
MKHARWTQASWRYFKLKGSIRRTSYVKGDYAIGKIPKWPQRLNKAPARAIPVHIGNDFEADTSKWTKKDSTLQAIVEDEARNFSSTKCDGFKCIFWRGLIGVYHD